MQKNISERRKKPKESDAQSMLHFDHFVFILCSKIVKLNFLLLQRRPKNCKMSVPRGNSSNRRSTSRSTTSTRFRPRLPAQKPLIRRSCQRKKRISAAFCSRFSSRAVELSGHIEALNADFAAKTWLRIMCALSTFDDAGRTNSNDCCTSTYPQIHPLYKRPRFQL